MIEHICQNTEWKPITGFEDYYQVSNMGEIKSLQRELPRSYGVGTSIKRERIMKPRKHSRGYYSIALRVNKEITQFFIHRIVAVHFVDNSNNKPQVNHKNGNKTDNRAENLEWVTPSENTIHALASGLMGKGWFKCKIEKDDYSKIRELYKGGMRQKDIANIYNVRQSTISNLVNSTKKTYGRTYI